jgi:hypothetical protein
MLRTIGLAFLGAIIRILQVLAAVLGNANSSAFLAPLPRVDPVPTPGGDAKKCQQASSSSVDLTRLESLHPGLMAALPFVLLAEPPLWLL